MSTDDNWIRAREEYANRIPDPTRPKLPQSGRWMDEELAFFWNVELITVQRYIRKVKPKSIKLGGRYAAEVDDLFNRGFDVFVQEEEGKEAAKRGGQHLEAAKRTVRDSRYSARNTGPEATEGDSTKSRSGKSRKGPTR